jgi:hypothetical protein
MLIEILDFEWFFYPTTALYSPARCSTYYSTPPLGRNCKPCIWAKISHSKKEGGCKGNTVLLRDTRYKRRATNFGLSGLIQERSWVGSVVI